MQQHRLSLGRLVPEDTLEDLLTLEWSEIMDLLRTGLLSLRDYHLQIVSVNVPESWLMYRMHLSFGEFIVLEAERSVTSLISSEP